MALLDAYGHEILQPDIHDPTGVSVADARLLGQMVEEIRAFDEADARLVLSLSPLSAVQIAGLLQLALRHQDVNGDSRATALHVLDGLREYFVDAPATLEVLRRGDA